MNSHLKVVHIQRLFLTCILCISIQLQSQSLEKYAFNIPAQPAQSALIQLALQRDLEIVFYAELADDVMANSLEGEFSLTIALDKLLDGSGLRASINNNRVIQIERVLKVQVTKIQDIQKKQDATSVEEPLPVKAEPVEEVLIVVAQMISPYNLGTTVSSTKTQRDFLDTPQIVNAMPEELTTDIGARDFTDITLLASSATYLERSSGVVDELRLRGFGYPSLKINGIGAHAYIAPVDVAFIERIEIAKGPGSVLFGRMEPGGIINMMLHQPEDRDERLVLRHGSDDYKRLELDLSTTFDEDTSGRIIAFRQDYGDAESLDLDDAQGVMLGIEHYLPNNSRLSVHYRYESQNVLQQFGSPIEGFDNSVEFFRDENGQFDVVIPKQSDLRSGLDVDRHSGYLAVNDWLIGDWSADFHLQYDRYTASSFVRYPVIENFVIDFNDLQVTQEQLTAALIANPEFVRVLTEGIETISVDPDNLFFEEEQFNYNTEFLSTEFTLYQSQFVGDMELEQLYGVNINRSSPETLVWQTHDTRASFLPLGTADIFFNIDDINRDVTDKNVGIFGQWVMNWEKFTLFLGARLDYLDFEVSNVLSTTSETFTESSFRIGAVYSLTDQSSLFLNYSEAFTPQFDLLELRIPVNEDFVANFSTIAFPDPARSYQYELGYKSTSFNGKVQTSCAIYEIIKTDIDSIIEEQQSQGLECDMSGSLGDGWHITMGFNYLDALITETAEEDLVNKRPRMAPENSGRLWLSRDLALSETWQSRWGFGINYIDKRFLDSANFDELSAYTVVDFGVSFTNHHDLTLSLLLLNAFDETYTEGVFDALPFWTNPGRERTLETRLEYRF